jgi:hypothetical protein
MGLFNSPTLKEIESSAIARWGLLLLNYAVLLAVVVGFSVSFGKLADRDAGLAAFTTIAATADQGFYTGLADSIKTNYMPGASPLYLSAAVIDDVETYTKYARHGDNERWHNMRHTVLLLGVVVGVFAIIFNTLYIVARSDRSFMDARHLTAVHGSLHVATHLLMMVVFLHLIVIWSERELTSTTIARALQLGKTDAIESFITTYRNGAGGAAASRHFRTAHSADTAAGPVMATPPASFWDKRILYVATDNEPTWTWFSVMLFYFMVFAHGSVVHLGHQALTDVISAVSGSKGSTAGRKTVQTLRTVSSHPSRTPSHYTAHKNA